MRAKLIYTTALATLLLSSIATKAQVSWDAETYYKSGYWTEAISAFKKNIKDKTPTPEKDEYYQKIGVSYYHLKDYQAAYESFMEVSSVDNLSAEGVDKYYSVLRTQQKYPQAERLLNNAPNKEVVKVNLPEAANIAELNVRYNMLDANFGRHFIGINLHGDKAIFSYPHKSKEDQTEYYDLYQSGIDPSGEIKVGEKKLLIKDNRKVYYRGAPTAIDYNGKTSYIYCGSMSEHDRYKQQKENKKSLSDSGHNNLILFRAYLNDSDEWESVELSSLNLKGYNMVTPYYDKDAQTLYFSCDQPGTGGYDIYSTKLVQDNNTGGNWSPATPINGINSASDDVFPFAYSNQLYFSSRGHQNYGGLDLFKFNNNNEVKNLGKKVNSSYDDFSMVWKNDSTGYFASNKESENGKDKLYLFYTLQEIIYCQFHNQHHEPIDGMLKVTFDNGETDELLIKANDPINYYISGKNVTNISFEDTYGTKKDLLLAEDFDLEDNQNQLIYTPNTIFNQQPPLVTNKITSEPLEKVKVTIRNKSTGKEDVLYTDANGNWDFPFEKNTHYDLTFEKENFTTLNLVFEGDRSSLANTGLEPTDQIDVLRIQNIVFDFDSHHLQDRSYAILDEVSHYLKTYPDISVELSAHTDCYGTEKYNQKLSDRRARTCKKYLIKSGINSNRLQPVGYGEKFIINGCTTEDQCSKEQNEENRRVEIKILNK